MQLDDDRAVVLELLERSGSTDNLSMEDLAAFQEIVGEQDEMRAHRRRIAALRSLTKDYTIVAYWRSVFPAYAGAPSRARVYTLRSDATQR